MAELEYRLGTGFAKVNQLLRNWRGQAILKALRRGQREALRPVQREARRLAPVDQGWLYNSYRIRAAKRKRGRVMHRVTSDSKLVKNKKGIYYGGFQHWGWKLPSGEKMPENDSLTRAADNKRRLVPRIMARSMREVLETQI